MQITSLPQPQWFHLRLQAGADVFQGLRDFMDEENLARAFVLSSIGSVSKITCNYPVGQNMPPDVCSQTIEKMLEVNGISGEIWRENSLTRVHLHGSVTHEATTLYGGGIADGAKVLVQLEMVIIGFALESIRERNPACAIYG